MINGTTLLSITRTMDLMLSFDTYWCLKAIAVVLSCKHLLLNCTLKQRRRTLKSIKREAAFGGGFSGRTHQLQPEAVGANH